MERRVPSEQDSGEGRVGGWRAEKWKKEKSSPQLNKPSHLESLQHLGCLEKAWPCGPQQLARNGAVSYPLGTSEDLASPGLNLQHPTTQPPHPGSWSPLLRAARKKAYPRKNQRIGGQGSGEKGDREAKRKELRRVATERREELKKLRGRRTRRTNKEKIQVARRSPWVPTLLLCGPLHSLALGPLGEQ